ncbi:MAG: hypothetical protein JWO79_3138 [Actinomycetia bacterium]|nr:hypothetical protein [Actinomycetes bacterium]
MILAAPRYLAETDRRPGRRDLAGALASTLGMAALVYGLVRSADAGWDDPVTVAALRAGVVLLVAFVFNESRARQPIMPLRLFASRADRPGGARIRCAAPRCPFAGRSELGVAEPVSGVVAGIDPARALDLAARLSDASAEAGRIAQAIRAADEAAAQAIARAQASLPALSRTDRAALSAVAAQAPVMAGEIRRRVAHLRGCQASGLPVDPALYFGDERPPDPAKVAAVVRYFHDHVGDHGGLNGDRDDLDGITARIRSLGAAETDAFVNSLSTEDLDRWNDRAAEDDDVLWHHTGLDPAGRTDLANLLVTKVAARTLAKLAAHLPVLGPDIHTKYLHDVHLAPQSGSLFGPHGIDLDHDLSQGQDGDCWFLASLGAVALTDPDWIRDHVRANENGTFTVTLYRDGRPVEVTVSLDLPLKADGAVAYAQTPDRVLWVAVYEKACAELRGGYGAIDGGSGSDGLTTVTGKPVEREDPADLSFAALKNRLDQGYAMTTGSASDDFLWWNHEYADNDKVVTSHEYVVTGIDLNTKPPTMTLLNPWGRLAGKRHIIAVSEAEWHHYFDELSAIRTGG